eukprot:m.35499 g.35499  ORF g.35499 m.35499 type:complete len:320 (+) comp5289_c0_seq2:183-1142(+)
MGVSMTSCCNGARSLHKVSPRLIVLPWVRWLGVAMVAVLWAAHPTAHAATPSPPPIAARRLLDDWTATDLRQFFLDEADVDVSVDKITHAGLRVDDLFDGRLDDRVLEHDLGVTSVLKRKRIIEAARALDSALTAHPRSFVEWRFTNRRLCDFWVLPLTNAPRMFLLWLRYGSPDFTNALEDADDSVDKIPLIDFWVTWTLVPSLPQAVFAGHHNARGMADTVMYIAAILRAMHEAVTAVTVVMTGSTHILFAPLRGEFGLFVWSLFSYHVLYWFWPTIFLDALFYATIYILMPFRLYDSFRKLQQEVRRHELWQWFGM